MPPPSPASTPAPAPCSGSWSGRPPPTPTSPRSGPSSRTNGWPGWAASPSCWPTGACFGPTCRSRRPATCSGRSTPWPSTTSWSCNANGRPSATATGSPPPSPRHSYPTANRRIPHHRRDPNAQDSGNGPGDRTARNPGRSHRADQSPEEPQATPHPQGAPGRGHDLHPAALTQLKGPICTQNPATRTPREKPELVDAPWDAPALRETTFEGGRGLLWFRVDDDAETIHVFVVTWARPWVPTRAVRVGRGGP